tara:strand:+ start:272 stop:961 length:690 start_codon:yes stop_codon:yes gene_type:complete
MKNYLFYIIILLSFSCSGSKEKYLHPDVVSPDIYEVLLENDVVKVIMVTFGPGQKDKMHDHNPMTFHVIEGGKAKVTMPDGTVNEREIPSGFTGYNAAGQRHQVTNIGENEVKILLIEEKTITQKMEAKEEFLYPESSSPDIYEVLLENEHVKVMMVTFEAGESDQMHDHNPMTFHVIQGGKAKVTMPDGTVNEREIPSGFTGYNPEGQRHQVTNIGDNQVRILLVEHS